MKKPRFYKEISIDTDLTEVSVNRAMTEIIDITIENELYGIDWWVLRVPSQLMGQAAYMLAHIGATMEISSTYNPDEWSLEKNALLPKDGLVKIIVHSNGG